MHTIRTLLEQTQWSKVAEVLEENHRDELPVPKDIPEILNRYKGVADHLKTLTPIPSTLEFNRLVAYKDPIDASIVNLALVKPTYETPPAGLPWSQNTDVPKGCYRWIQEKHDRYCFDSYSWAMLMDIPLHFEAEITNEVVLASFLYELTFMGWEEKDCIEANNVLMEELNRRVEEIEAGTVKLLSADEVRQNLFGPKP